MKMETLPVETAVEWVTAWAGLSWPVSWETAFAIRDRLGWVSHPKNSRFFVTSLSTGEADGGMTKDENGLFRGIDFSLATVVVRGQEEPDTAFVTWAAYESYVEALAGVFGQPRTEVRRRGAESEHRNSKWYLPNRSSFSLTALPGVITVYVFSPEQTWADLEDQRLTEEYGENWEDFIE
ncbi:DUF6301 family protein [Actinomyces respiraculi]|uniref:DUF6301 family protein n=1 Tax=Actinomyces respiraculi TaxID=2744574 RepID=UPI0014234FFF|nr:DUF6301 family protein [Actinomyces respiraculi]